MAGIKPLKTKGAPVDYMDVQTLWNDRRDPHASPLSSAPRRMYDRAPGPSALGGLVDQIYRPGAEDTEAKESKPASAGWVRA